MLHLHTSERADALIRPLASVLAQPLPDPFATEVVAVPTRGVERWLAQSLSHFLGAGSSAVGDRDGGGEAGVCAGVSFDSPSWLMAQVQASVLDLEPVDDPWRPERLVWTVVDVVDGCAGQSWCAPLGRYLGVRASGADQQQQADDGEPAGEDGEVHRRGRRLAVSRRLTSLFTSYGAQRPAMLRAWAAAPVGRVPAPDGAGGVVSDDLAWQPQLWRRVRELVGVPSPAERLEDAAALVEREPGKVPLPARLSIFGATRLPEDHLRILRALSVHREVHMWLPHPSPALWQRVAALQARGRRRDLVSPAEHPLLASMARDATELQIRLSSSGASWGPGPQITHHRAPDPRPTLLGALQSALRADRPDADRRVGLVHTVDPADRSLEIHACHGRARQVEVLRDLVVGLLADDSTLEPRDVIVMCPDVESFAPLLGAAFGLAAQPLPGSAETQATGAAHPAAHPGQLMRVRLADRSLRLTNPHLSLVASLLELADARVSASEVLDLVASDPVRRRFRFDDGALERIREWAVAAGVHWGEGGIRRARFGLAGLRQGTWEVGLDRVLLGAAMAEEDHRYLASALPLDDVDSTGIDIAGRLAEFLDRLESVLGSLTGAKPTADWLSSLERGLDLLADTGPATAWQAVQARQVLADVREAASAGTDNVVRLADIRAILADRLRGRPTRAGFRTGALTVCSMEPMRAVPHRVVCLLGLDDGAFPRRGSSDGDDVLLRDPCLGEHDRRSEDRQLFLDAVTAAQDHLMVLYGGADERTGAPRPPAVPVGELLDALDRAAVTSDGGPVRERVVVRHPLQNVDERAFTANALRRGGPFSFDVLAYRAALAGRGVRAEPGPFLDVPLPREPLPDLLDLDDLVAMLEHTAKWFLRRRLGLYLRTDEDEVEDRLPLRMDPLGEWAVGDRLLAAVRDGVAPRVAASAEWRRGGVPPRELGRAVLERIEGNVAALVVAVRPYESAPPRSVDVSADLPGGTRLTGTVPGVQADCVVRAVYSRLGPKHRLRAWVQLLALAAGGGGRSWTAVTVGRGQGHRPRASVARLRAPAPVAAAQRLDELVRLRASASAEPLPMPVSAAAQYARARYAGNDEVQALGSARATWEGSRGENMDEHHALCWGPAAALEALLSPPQAEEQAWWPQDRTRLGVLARRVWQPLLDHEESHGG